MWGDWIRTWEQEWSSLTSEAATGLLWAGGNLPTHLQHVHHWIRVSAGSRSAGYVSQSQHSSCCEHRQKYRTLTGLWGCHDPREAFAPWLLQPSSISAAVFPNSWEFSCPTWHQSWHGEARPWERLHLGRSKHIFNIVVLPVSDSWRWGRTITLILTPLLPVVVSQGFNISCKSIQRWEMLHISVMRHN